MINNIIIFLTNHSPFLYWIQSLWRDEAFSVWIAQDSFSEIIRRTSGDFNPPLYYVLLHYWMQIFGRSETILRGLSFLCFLLTVVAVYYLAKKIFASNRWGAWAAWLTIVNPMLLYFAFEVRMYSLLVLFTVLSMLFLWEKKWLLYILVTTAGIYTQPFMSLVILAQTVFLLLKKQYRQLLVNGFLIGLFFLPWLPTLLTQFKASGPMWMWPVDLNLVTSVLGNLFFGYEGTPGGLWNIMKIVSLLFIFTTFLVLKSRKKTPVLWLVLLWMYLPVALVLMVSLVKPIYVHRYLIFVVPGEILLVVCGLRLLPKQLINKVGVSIVGILLVSNFLIAKSFHKKVDLRDAFTQIIPLLKPEDQIYAQTPLVYYECLYYTPKNFQVKLYNPYQITPPRYVGSIGMPASTWADNYPNFPKRAFVIAENATYQIFSNL